ncbi:MAG: hypothetical protein AAGM38_09950 [Pseudomonadota bacterium]
MGKLSLTGSIVRRILLALVAPILLFLVVASFSSSPSAQARCGTPVQCYEFALEQLIEARQLLVQTMADTEMQIDSLESQLSSLRTANQRLEARLQAVDAQPTLSDLPKGAMIALLDWRASFGPRGSVFPDGWVPCRQLEGQTAISGHVLAPIAGRVIREFTSPDAPNIGGANVITVPGHFHDLSVGASPDGFGLREDNGAGIINHPTPFNVVRSRTHAEALQSFDNQSIYTTVAFWCKE